MTILKLKRIPDLIPTIKASSQAFLVKASLLCNRNRHGWKNRLMYPDRYPKIISLQTDYLKDSFFDIKFTSNRNTMTESSLIANEIFRLIEEWEQKLSALPVLQR